MKTSRTKLIFFAGLLGLLGPGIIWAQKYEKIEITKEASVLQPSSWSRLARVYRNAIELVARKETAGGKVRARMLITTDDRKDHADAVRRLAEIAVEVRSPLKLNMLEIGGWPAIERRYMAPLPEVGGQSSSRPLSGIDHSAILSMRVTTAIAAAKTVFRLETVLAPDASPSLADQAESIGRSAAFSTKEEPAEVQREIHQLREIRHTASGLTPLPAAKRLPVDLISVPPESPTPTTGSAVLVQNSFGELEIAVSNNGRNVVIAHSNSGYSASSDGGATFPVSGPIPASFANGGDPSLAVGASGTFYYAFIGYPNGTPAANNVTGCATSIAASVNAGQSFIFRNHAFVCPLVGSNMCFPDQEHIAADRANTATGGGDQVYSVWRNFAPLGNPPNCPNIINGNITPSIVCSTNGGTTWSAPVAIDSGDFPRIAVAQDGSVYVVYRTQSNLMLKKFSPCAAGLVPQPAVTVASVNDPFNTVCPIPGLDRCESGNTMSSHTVAIDDTNSSHVYVAYADDADNQGTLSDILVRDSVDGGLTWSPPVKINSPTIAPRFMPWACSVGGAAYVSWYDRRSATSSNNDLTDYYVGTAFAQDGALRAGPELNLSQNPDPQCASGWPCSPRAQGDALSCRGPQLAGTCMNAAGTGSLMRCDFRNPVCPTGETCQTGFGCPKYGDYNGNACSAGRVFTAWASATSPTGIPPSPGIKIFSSNLEDLGGLLFAEGKPIFLRVHDLGTGFGPPSDFLDVEIVVKLDSEPQKAFGLQLRSDSNQKAHRGMLDLLLNAFNHDTRVRIEYVRTGWLNNGRIVRVVSLR